MAVKIGTHGTVKFTGGDAYAIVSDIVDGERDLVVAVFCNAASDADGVSGVVAQYPTKVGDKVSDFTPAA